MFKRQSLNGNFGKSAGRATSPTLSTRLFYNESPFLNREDELFSQIGMVSREPIVEKDMKQLPATYNFNELDQLAGKIAAKAINNNKFEISNGFIANGLNQFYRN